MIKRIFCYKYYELRAKSGHKSYEWFTYEESMSAVSDHFYENTYTSHIFFHEIYGRHSDASPSIAGLEETIFQKNFCVFHFSWEQTVKQKSLKKSY